MKFNKLLLCAATIGLSFGLGFSLNAEVQGTNLNAASEETAPKFNEGQMLRFIISSEWSNGGDDLHIKVTFYEGDKEIAHLMATKVNQTNWCVKVPKAAVNATHMTLTRCKSETDPWNTSAKFECNGVDNLFCAADGNYDNATYKAHKMLVSSDFTNSVKKTTANRNEYVDIYLNRNNQYANTGFIHVLHFWGEQDGLEVMPLDYLPVVNSDNSSTYLAHYTVKKDILLGSKFQDKIYQEVPTEVENENVYFTLGSTAGGDSAPVYEPTVATGSTKASKVFYVAGSSIDKYTLSFGDLNEGQTVSKELAKSLFEGRDSCSTDKFTGCGELDAWKNCWHLENVKETILKETSIEDNKVGEASTFTCLAKLAQMEQTAKVPEGSNSINYISTNDTIIIVTAISVTCVLFAILGLTVFKKRKTEY